VISKSTVFPENATTRTKPFTSIEYFESLRDGREIWIYGERVKDVTTHPAFRNTVRMIGRLYDALHDDRKKILCTETDTGSGGYTHKFLRLLVPQRRWWAVGTRSRSGLA
jgi:4-hydroxyphenylacetate 3-monooxygenase